MAEDKINFETEWEASRKQGKFSYAGKEGILKGSVFSLALEVADGFFNADSYRFDWRRIALRLLVFVVGYFLYGLWRWRKNEGRFQQSATRNETK